MYRRSLFVILGSGRVFLIFWNCRQYPLPGPYQWCPVDVNDAAQLEELYTLLTNHYVEDDEAMFRFDYSKEFLLWALCPPHYRVEWHLGVRSSAGKLVAFISAVPALMQIHSKSVISLSFALLLCISYPLNTFQLHADGRDQLSVRSQEAPIQGLHISVDDFPCISSRSLSMFSASLLC